MKISGTADATPATGILWAYRFGPDGAAELISHDRIQAVLNEHSGHWIWLHLARADTRCRTPLYPRKQTCAVH
jgi:hypothetical protein